MNRQIVWTPGISLEDVEKQVILKAYRHFQSNKTATSIALGISIRTLDARLAKFDEDTKAATEAEYDARQRRQEQLNRARGIVTKQSPAVQAPIANNDGKEASAQAPDGIRGQPVAEAAPQQQVPVPQREEVQSLLQRDASTGRYGRASR